LFYTGIAASNSGNNELAAERWERLAGLNPPEEIRGILQQKIAEWRGLPAESVVPGASAAVAATPEPAAAPPGTIISINMALADEAAAAISGDPGIFVIARDPNAPAPPIAVLRTRASDLPTTVHLSDSNSMVAGRSLSAFAEFEVLVRVSASGQPMAQPGDWFGSAIAKPSDSASVDIVINQQVP
jgi:cytochrome c-type biogenesis protein CcmH